MAAFASITRVFAPVALILMGLGCRPEVGDPCKRAADCGLYVVRQCDVSNAPRDSKNQGECIVENCSYGSCPNEAVCVKVYSTELLSLSCDPEAEDINGRDDCLPHEICLPEGLCAYEVRARNSCRRRCNKDNDCRQGYECVATGAGGVYMAPDPEDPTLLLTDSICVPRS
jgi:hypothetical protein